MIDKEGDPLFVIFTAPVKVFVPENVCVPFFNGIFDEREPSGIGLHSLIMNHQV